MNYKYYVVQSSNGVVSIVSEWGDLNKAVVAYCDRCKALANAADVIDGYVEIIYSADMGVVSANDNTYRMHISHPQAAE